MFELLHWSDSHNAETVTKSTRNLYSTANVDGILHTGDIVYNVSNDSIDYVFDGTNIPFMLVLGNHDTLSTTGAVSTGYQWDIQPSQTYLYDKFLKPILNTGIDVNKTWWRKLYIDKSIMIIGLNSCVFGDLVNEELNWLDIQLQYCKEMGYDVLIASHIAPTYSNVKICNFTDDYNFVKNLSDVNADLTKMNSFYKNGNIVFGTSAYEKVNNFSDNGGKVIAWISGHVHSDGVFLGGNNVRYPIVVIGSTVIDSSNNVGRINSYNYTDSVVTNLYKYDGSQFAIYRLGANNINSGGLRDMICFNYEIGDYVSSFTRQ